MKKADHAGVPVHRGNEAGAWAPSNGKQRRFHPPASPHRKARVIPGEGGRDAAGSEKAECDRRLHRRLMKPIGKSDVARYYEILFSSNSGY